MIEELRALCSWFDEASGEQEQLVWDAIIHIQALEDQLQAYEGALQRAMDIYTSETRLEDEALLMYSALEAEYGDKNAKK